MTSLTGKTALVTGGGRGIGAAIVRRLAGEGAAVVFNYKADEAAAQALVAELTAAGRPVRAVRADSAESGGIERLFAFCEETFGPAPNLDILVNNAGVGRGERDASLSRGDEALFEELMAINAKGPFLVTSAALPRLRDNGRIVNVGSISGKVAQHFAAAYAMSKRALQSLTFSTATQVAKRGITCNLIAPGAVETDFIAVLMAKPGFEEGTARATPMGRLGQPDDIAGAVVMLCREEARWVTGNIIEAAGGLSI